MIDTTGVKSFVSPAMEAKVCRLAVAQELVMQATENHVALTATTDLEALVIGLLAHLSAQNQSILEVLSGFTHPVKVVFTGDAGDIVPTEVN